MRLDQKIVITDVRFVAAEERDVERGLIGFVSAKLNHSLQIDGLALRRTRDGRLTISFPARRDTAGRQHHFLRPLNDQIRREIEEQILRAIGMKEGTK